MSAVLGVVTLLVLLLVWALVARRLARLSITTAIAIVIAGIALTAGSHPPIRINLDTKVVERGVEVVLAFLLFNDATEVPGGILRRERKVVVRLLVIALPLSLAFAWLAGFALFRDRNVWLVAVIAVIVVPVDLAPAVAIVRDQRVPGRLRDIINVESGLNDGLVAPVFLFCLAAAATAHGSPAVAALEDAVPAILIAVGVGAVVGAAGARALGWSWKRGWTDPTALRLGVWSLPILAYTVSLELGGNGFVAAFVAGLLFAVRDRGLPPEALQLSEDVGALLALIVWFIFGQAVNQVFAAGITVAVVVYAVLAVTVVRTLPVLLALRGTNVGFRDALFLGWMGPRGLASLVFGLLAVIALKGDPSSLAAQVMVITVLLSVLVHGATAGPIGAAYARAREGRRVAEPGEPAEPVQRVEPVRPARP